VYQAEPAERRSSVAQLLRGRFHVSRNVWFLGLTSLFTDISSEMVASILPAYLVLQLGVSPMVFGAIDGVYQGVGSLVRWIGGAAADRSRRHKELAAAGYGLSALCRIGLLLAGNAWTTVTALVALDRIGKGFRTAPRDALISLSARGPDLATAFGVHRALDALGALVGPLVAFAILARSPRGFDQVFVASFSVAIVGLACILLFVENAAPSQADAPAGSFAARRGWLEATAVVLRHSHFRVLMLVACVLAAATVSDAFVYLLLQRRAQFGPQIFPLLAASTAVFYVILAVPAGRLADRLGRAPVFIGGHVALAGVYAMLWLSDGAMPVAFVCVLLLGSYYAMTDGVLAAAASAILPPHTRGTGLALLATAVSLARLLSSFVFGWTWTRYGTAPAIAAFAVALAIGIALAVSSRHRLERGAA
jgi:MFS family permease